MLGFGKNKKGRNEPDTQDAPENKPAEKKKRTLFSRKKIFILFLIAVGASSFFVCPRFLTSTDPHDPRATYKKIELRHINLPDEMIRFSFNYFPDLYISMLTFNSEMDLFDKEIQRIGVIAQTYPDQQKIANKEKKAWEKAKNDLQKGFSKINTPVKETYVLFCVNKELGLAQIEVKKNELTEIAGTALTPAQEMTQTLKSKETVPQGWIKGSVYKLKKKFL